MSDPNFNQIERNFQAIRELFSSIPTPFTAESLHEQLFSKFNRDEILEAVDDSESAKIRPGLLFLILETLDPQAQSLRWVAPMVESDSEVDDDVKARALTLSSK